MPVTSLMQRKAIHLGRDQVSALSSPEFAVHDKAASLLPGTRIDRDYESPPHQHAGPLRGYFDSGVTT